MKKAIFCLLFAALIAGCSKESEEIKSEPVSDYMPLEVGKYLVYLLDSTIMRPLGGTWEDGFEVKQFQVRDLIEEKMTDGANRESYRVVRSRRNADGTGEWTPISTYMITPVNGAIETVEHNLRFRKLQLPIRDDFSWKGNNYIDTYSAESQLKYMDNWDYLYEFVGEPFQTPMKLVEHTITVNQRDEIIGSPGSPLEYFQINFAKEVYGKNIGLIYKEFVHKEYQPLNKQYVDGSYGIRLQLIDHN